MASMALKQRSAQAEEDAWVLPPQRGQTKPLGQRERSTASQHADSVPKGCRNSGNEMPCWNSSAL